MIGSPPGRDMPNPSRSPSSPCDDGKRLGRAMPTPPFNQFLSEIDTPGDSPARESWRPSPAGVSCPKEAVALFAARVPRYRSTHPVEISSDRRLDRACPPTAPRGRVAASERRAWSSSRLVTAFSAEATPGTAPGDGSTSRTMTLASIGPLNWEDGELGGWSVRAARPNGVRSARLTPDVRGRGYATR